jgi:hypothetical protein
MTVPYHFRPAGRFYVPRAHRYEYAKREWDKEHPNATPAERDKAIREICKRLKF